MIQLNQANFSIKFQEMLEKYYLQPFDGTNKKNIKNGFIERATHGAQHASRATLWALIINNLLQKILPKSVDESLETIAKHINSDTETLILLILMTMGCHDAARKGEGRDNWEPESAALALGILKELGLTAEQAQLFAAAIEFKDIPDGYQAVLKKLGIEEKDFNHFDYIRKIVNLGDNLDLMRCIGQFKLKYIFDTLLTIDGFNDSHHDIIIELIKEIHQFIYDQYDMRFACTVRDLKGNEVVSHQYHHSKKEKVKYEHADNVFAAIFADALQSKKFAPFISAFYVPETRKYEGEAAFDPFVHGTNASIFSILPSSDMSIKSPLEMIEDDQAAPMTGELTNGGYARVGGDLIKNEVTMGRTSFGIMSATGENSYTFEKILKYTKLAVSSKQNSLYDFKYEIQRGLGRAFSNINLLLIYFTRARQTYKSLEKIITKEELETLREELQATVQFYYFMQLLGTHIHPNFAAIKQFGMGEEVSRAADELLTFENIIAKIIKNKIDMKEIHANPTPENLQKALSVLEFPEHCTLTLWGPKPKAIEFPNTQFFCLEPNYPDDVKDIYKANNTFDRLAQNGSSSGYGIEHLLMFSLEGKATSSFFIELGIRAKQHIIALNDRIRLFEKLVATPQSQFKLTALQHYFLDKNFPIILVAEDEELIQLHTHSRDEYRSKTALKLGKDIKIIATDTNDHRLEVMKYLELHQINNIQVVLFADLQKSKLSKEKPSAPHHHPDGVPTLKWLSAKEVSSRGLTFFKDKASSLNRNSTNTAEVYAKKNIKEAAYLLEDAEKYHEIDFINTSLFPVSAQRNEKEKEEFLLDHFSDRLPDEALNQIITHNPISESSLLEEQVTQLVPPKEKQDSDDKNLDQSSLSQEQYSQIVRLKEKLENEIKSCWPYPNKDRKQVKVNALSDLLAYTKTEDVLTSIKRIKTSYKSQGVFDGVLSKRTYTLFKDLKRDCRGQNKDMDSSDGLVIVHPISSS